uniref:Uncharacterized protein n=1 Tax=Physcomitrium patens TaxID=3218 RepID=A0A2K1JZK3_PHYPA|nr:hypothetical protein PHYPA_014076 [Physcomitrium patens]
MQIDAPVTMTTTTTTTTTRGWPIPALCASTDVVTGVSPAAAQLCVTCGRRFVQHACPASDPDRTRGTLSCLHDWDWTAQSARMLKSTPHTTGIAEG